MAYEIVARVESPSTHMALVAALRAYGFHPLDQLEGGLPGGTIFVAKGIPIQVPEEEAADATILAAALLDEMNGDGPQNSHIEGG